MKPTVLAIAGIAFLVLRLAAFVHPFPGWGDVAYYETLVREAVAAREAGCSIYEWRSGSAAGASALIEYPPLFLAVLKLPLLWQQTWLADLTYVEAFRLGVMAVDASVFCLLLVLCERCFPGESAADWLERVVAYPLLSAALWPQLYDMLDLPLGFLLLAAAALLCSAAPFVLSFIVLALAVNLKVTPVILLPLWACTFVSEDKPSRRVLLGVPVRGLLLAAMVVAIFLPFFLMAGWPTLDFVTYHAERGLQEECLYASLLRLCDQPVEFYGGHGCTNIRSPHSPLVLALAPWICLSALALLSVLVLRATWSGRWLPVAIAQSRGWVNLPILVGAALLFLMSFMATNKVFSPQYLLWIVPLAPLAPFGTMWRRLFLGTLFVVCLCTTLGTPLFANVPAALTDWSPVFFHLRNLLFLLLTLALLLWFVRKTAPGAGDAR